MSMEQPGKVVMNAGQSAVADDAHLNEPPHTQSEDGHSVAQHVALSAPAEVALVPQLVAAQATKTPLALALAAGDLTLTYGAMNRRANQLAHHLRALGVGPDALVAVCLERSPDLVVALLAIHKAGGAYLPLDHHYPPDRLAYILADAAPRLLVTSAALRGTFAPDMADVCVDRDAGVLGQLSDADPLCDTMPDHLAYVIYTSGSTGQPKGVEITHRGLLNLVYWHQREFAVVPDDRATQLASPAFDATGWELWPYLTAGASIHLPDESTRVDPLALRDWLVAQRITITFLPTPLAEHALGLDWPATTSLRLMLTGADTLHVYPPASIPFALINNYGPTEATVVATSTRVPPTDQPATTPSIGRPIDNVQVYLLDDTLHEVAAGTAGELYIGGAGVARGYRNRRELTAERFIPHPFDTSPHARLYRTGDVARYLPDGQLAFLGRADEQVKIRGYRIEPGEVTAALDRIAAVRASCVVARPGADGQAQLVAYVLPQPGEQLTLSMLQRQLATRLPDYMIPSLFVRVDHIPITPNGKVDRAALPEPDATNMVAASHEAGAAPATPLQVRLTEIVAQTLGLQTAQVGLDDNFFLLGGHSMLGTQVIALISRAFAVDLSLRMLFDAPTVRQLADEVERLILIKIEAMSDDEVQRLLG